MMETLIIHTLRTQRVDIYEYDVKDAFIEKALT